MAPALQPHARTTTGRNTTTATVFATFLCLGTLAIACATDTRSSSANHNNGAATNSSKDATNGSLQPDPLATPSAQPSILSTELALHARTAATHAAVHGLRPHTLHSVRRALRAADRERVIDALTYSIDTYTTPEDQDAARYILGKLLTDDLDPRGLPYLEALPAPFEGDLDDLRRLWLARAQALAGHHQDAIDTIDRLLRDEPDLDERHELRVTRAHSLAALGQHDLALRALERLAADGTAPEHLRAQALLDAANALRHSDPDRARKHEHTLITRFPAQPAALDPALELRPHDLSDDERYARARILMDSWHYDEARDELRRLVDHPTHGYDAAFRVGVIALRKLRDDVPEARAMFERVLAEGGRHAEDALYYLIRTWLREENYDKGLELADRYAKRYPRGKYSDRIAYWRGWLPYDHRDCKTALPALERYWKTGDDRSTVMGFWAWCFIREKDWEGAVDAFGELAERYGNTVIRGKAWYWQAYALHQLGRDSEALATLAELDQRYPLAYYSVLGWQLRARIEGRDPTASRLPWPGHDDDTAGTADERFPVDDPELWDWPQGLSSSTRSALHHVRRLTELGEYDRARRRYRAIQDTVEKAVPAAKRKHFVLFIVHQVEDYHRAWQLSGEHLSQPGTPDATDVAWSLAYPRAWGPLVERLAMEHGVPATLVFAIMRQESRYRPWQISGADAVGALQMIPQTARRVAQDLGVAFDLRTFTRPEEGFRYSFHYIRRHLDTWKGQLVPTAASYNGGPEPIARWIHQNRGEPMAFLIEEFAYNESRIYCRKVAEHMLRYLYLYEDDPAVRGPLLDALFPVEFDYDIPDDIGY